MKTKYLVISNFLLASGVPALVETFGDSPAECTRFDERVDGYNNGQLIVAKVPAYVTNLTTQWLQGYVDALVRQTIGSPCSDEKEDEYEVIIVNHPTQGYTVAVVPVIAETYKVVANFGDTGTVHTTFQEALNDAQSLIKEEGVTYIDIDVYDETGDENGTFSYLDSPDVNDDEA